MELKELQRDSILVEIGKAEIESNFDKLNINAINNAIAEPCYSVIEK